MLVLFYCVFFLEIKSWLHNERHKYDFFLNVFVIIKFIKQNFFVTQKQRYFTATLRFAEDNETS